MIWFITKLSSYKLWEFSKFIKPPLVGEKKSILKNVLHLLGKNVNWFFLENIFANQCVIKL